MAESVRIQIVRLPSSEGIDLPAYQTEESAGMDLRAAVHESITLVPGHTREIPTGLKISIPKGYEGQIRSRSGLALRKRIVVVNSPGTIDSDFRGEIVIGILNLGNQDFVVERGARLAQLVIAPVVRAAWELVKELDVTERGEGGLGHTGNS